MGVGVGEGGGKQEVGMGGGGRETMEGVVWGKGSSR